jgi:hypothetical protein
VTHDDDEGDDADEAGAEQREVKLMNRETHNEYYCLQDKKCWLAHHKSACGWKYVFHGFACIGILVRAPNKRCPF